MYCIVIGPKMLCIGQNDFILSYYTFNYEVRQPPVDIKEEEIKTQIESRPVTSGTAT